MCSDALPYSQLSDTSSENLSPLPASDARMFWVFHNEDEQKSAKLPDSIFAAAVCSYIKKNDCSCGLLAGIACVLQIVIDVAAIIIILEQLHSDSSQSQQECLAFVWPSKVLVLVPCFAFGCSLISTWSIIWDTHHWLQMIPHDDKYSSTDFKAEKDGWYFPANGIKTMTRCYCYLMLLLQACAFVVKAVAASGAIFPNPPTAKGMLSASLLQPLHLQADAAFFRCTQSRFTDAKRMLGPQCPAKWHYHVYVGQLILTVCALYFLVCAWCQYQTTAAVAQRLLLIEMYWMHGCVVLFLPLLIFFGYSACTHKLYQTRLLEANWHDHVKKNLIRPNDIKNKSGNECRSRLYSQMKVYSLSNNEGNQVRGFDLHKHLEAIDIENTRFLLCDKEVLDVSRSPLVKALKSSGVTHLRISAAISSHIEAWGTYHWVRELLYCVRSQGVSQLRYLSVSWLDFKEKAALLEFLMTPAIHICELNDFATSIERVQQECD